MIIQCNKRENKISTLIYSLQSKALIIKQLKISTLVYNLHRYSNQSKENATGLL